jgi:glycosyltransferase involved in cell wall biosynthesis
MESKKKSYSKTKLSSDVSVVICTRNVEADIENCIRAVIKNRPKEILVIDGRSTDKTLEILESLKIRHLSDEGQGLAHARKLGVDNTVGSMVMFVGPDNMLPENFITDLVRLRKEWGFDVASVSTRTANPKNYWDKGMDFRWLCNMGTAGETDVPGTPNLYDRTLFKAENFSSRDLGGADDTDLCERLRARGYKLGIVPLIVYEKNGWTMRKVWNRFKFYGTGDCCFYDQYRLSWTLWRRLQSLTHPLRQTLDYSKIAISKGKTDLLPWLFCAMLARYYGWLTYKRGNIKNFSDY